MKNERKRIQDLKQLSAYLDGELNLASRQQLEIRLSHEPALRAKLENLHTAKVLLSRLPRQQAPRNFTLTPDMVPVQRRAHKPLFTTLKLATSLAAILLVILVGFEFLVIDNLQGRMAMAPEAVMEVATFADEPTPEPLILWADPPQGLGQAEMDVDAFSEPVVELEVAPPDVDPPEEPVLEEEEPLSDEPLSDEPLSDEPLSVPKEKSEPRPKQDMLILGINPDQGGEIIERSVPASYMEEMPRSQPGTLRLIQYALAIIFLTGGLTLWALYHRQ